MGHGGFGGFHGGGGFRFGGGHPMAGIGRVGHPNLGQHLQQQHLQHMQQELHVMQQHQLQAAQQYHQQLTQAHQQMLAEANQLHQLKLNNAHLQQEVNQGNTVNVNRTRNVNNGNVAAGESSIGNSSGAGSSFASILPSLLYTLPMYMMMMNRGGFGGGMGGYGGGMGGWPGYGGGMGGWPGGGGGGWPGYGGGFMPYANWNNPGGRWNNRFQPGGQPNMQQMQQFQQMLAVAELNDLRTWAAQGWITVPSNSPLYSLVYPGQRGTPPGTIVPPPPPPGDVAPYVPTPPLPGIQNYYAPADQGNYNLTSADSQPYANNVVYGSPYYSYTNCGSRRRPFAFVGRALHNLFS